MSGRGGVEPSGEDRLIASYFRPLATAPGALSLLDDAALLRPQPGCDLVLTADALVAGVHFFPDDGASSIARKALRVNLSDLAAKGADPAGFLLALALPLEFGAEWVAEFAAGLGKDAETYACPLLGGDTIRTPGPLTISITAVGTVPAGQMVHRSGARPGDRIFVTGTIGDAALGLHLRANSAGGESAGSDRWGLSPDQRVELTDRYLHPRPRNGLAGALRAHASAAMDVSDGLAGDLAKLCAASGVTCEVNASAVPISDALRAVLQADPSQLRTVLTGGDDYEVLCTASTTAADHLHVAAREAGIRLTEIGEVMEGGGVPVFRDAAGKEMPLGRLSFSHF